MKAEVGYIYENYYIGEGGAAKPLDIRAALLPNKAPPKIAIAGGGGGAPKPPNTS